MLSQFWNNLNNMYLSDLYTIFYMVYILKYIKWSDDVLYNEKGKYQVL